MRSRVVVGFQALLVCIFVLPSGARPQNGMAGSAVVVVPPPGKNPVRKKIKLASSDSPVPIIFYY